MAILINGNGNKAIWAAQDADLIASLAGNVTGIAAVGNQFAATQEDASTIGLADGVIITKEGRRIQLDTGEVDLFTIPTGTAGVTSYYIIGYKLSQQSDTSQICETFVQKMNSASETIDEDTFKGGATEVYVSCYRVTQDGLNIDTIEGLLPIMGNISEGGGGDLYGKAKYIVSNTGYGVDIGTNCMICVTDLVNGTSSKKNSGSMTISDLDTDYISSCTFSIYGMTPVVAKKCMVYVDDLKAPFILNPGDSWYSGYNPQGNGSGKAVYVFE